jgi:hypothetical protein
MADAPLSTSMPTLNASQFDEIHGVYFGTIHFLFALNILQEHR